MVSDHVRVAFGVVAVSLVLGAAIVGCGTGDNGVATPRPSQKTVYQGETLDGRGGSQDCQWDATVEVEEDTVVAVLNQTRGARVVKPGDVVRDDMWPPPPEREGDKDFRGVEKQGPSGGRLFSGLLVHWTEEGVLRSGCKYPASPTPE